MEIKIQNLKKTYGSKTAVDIPDYTLQAPEILGLMGNNGAGKTTLFRLMLDLLKADSGSVCLDGIDVSQSEDWKLRVGAYMDESFLIDYLTPEEYFQFCGHIYGFDAATLHERIHRYERFLGDEILRYRHRPASQSGTRHSGRAVQLPRPYFTVAAQALAPALLRGT